MMPSGFSASRHRMRVGLRGDAFDFGDGNQRQEADEQQEKGEKQTECAEIGADINPSRLVITPVRGDEVAVEGSDDNDEPLEPHPDVHEDREHEHNDHAGAEPLEPVANVTLHINSTCRTVMTSSRWKSFRSGRTSVSTMPNPEKIAPATK